MPANAAKSRLVSAIPPPLRRAKFRQLWLENDFTSSLQTLALCRRKAMKNNLWKLATIVVVTLLAGCGPTATPTPVSVAPTATMQDVSPTDTPLSPTTPPTDTPMPTVQPTDTLVPTPAGSVIDDFEGGDFDDRWWSYTGEETVSFACTPDQPGHTSANAMWLTYEIGAGGYAACAVDVDSDRWGDAAGLSFSWRANQPGLTVLVILDMEDPMQTNPATQGETPFQVVLQTPGEEWMSVTLEWDDFAKAEWVSESGADVLDPTRVVALYLEVGEAQNGSIWFDDLQLANLVAAAAEPTATPTDTPEPTETFTPIPPTATPASIPPTALPAPPPDNVASPIISFSDGWEHGLTGGPGNWRYIDMMASDRFRQVTDPVRKGQYAVRIEVRPGDDPIDSGGERAEVHVMTDADDYRIDANESGGVQYYAFSVRFAPDWQPIEPRMGDPWGIVFQLHGPDSLGASQSFSVQVLDQFYIMLHSGDLDSPANSLQWEFYPLSNSDLNPGHWVDFVVRIKFASDFTGSVHVWRRDEGQADFALVLSVENVPTLQYRSSHGGVGDHYWKHGFYRSEQDTITHVLWLDGLTRGNTFDGVVQTAFP
jgi:hypothetical protein